MKLTPRVEQLLRSPRTGQAVRRAAPSADLRPIARRGRIDAPAFGVTPEVLLADDGLAFPVTDGFPVLMWPDALVDPARGLEADLDDRKYCEAYSEMAFYNPVALKQADEIESDDAWAVVSRIRAAAPDPARFPQPHDLWIDATHDTAAQLDAYAYLAPVAGRTILQLGGSGRHAVKFLLAGAAETALVTPMIGEAVFAWRLAGAAGVQDRLSCVLGVAEEMPFADDAFDGVLSAGCMHHMQLDIALPELRRVLVPGGRFAAWDPWRAPLYALGTWLFGKREQGLVRRDQDVFCKPFTSERLAPLPEHFPACRIANHGPLLRYPLLLMSKFGLEPSCERMIGIARLDDRLGQAIGLDAAWGGSIMIGGEKPA